MRHIVMLASLALASCTATSAPIAATPTPSAASGVVAQAGTVILSGARAFAAAELAYITAAKGVGIVADSGVIDGATARQVREWNAQARAILVKGKATADAAEQAQLATQLFGIADRLDALKGSN